MSVQMIAEFLIFLVVASFGTVFGDENSCVLPPYPEHGRYSVAAAPDAGPGTVLDTAFFTTACDPDYYVDGSNYVFCSQGFWGNDVPQCQRCGAVLPDEAGQTNPREVAPWHAGVYIKPVNHYICGASIVTSTIIISAAHCFWQEGEPGPKDAKEFGIAVGKSHMDWAASDPYAQTSDVSQIKLSTRYLGYRGNFQDDIALVTITSSFVFSRHVKPICLDFNYQFDEQQLRNGSVGKIAAWTSRNPQTTLKLLDVATIDIEQCIAVVPANFTAFITSDKTCGILQIGDIFGLGLSGTGAVFSEKIQGTKYYYLRGVLANSPRSNSETTLVALTHVIKHQYLIDNFIH